jgi:hypothetical protein
MLIIGVDYHPSFQQISFLDQETGECGDRQLNHSEGEVERFYRELKQRGANVRVGMEATKACQKAAAGFQQGLVTTPGSSSWSRAPQNWKRNPFG